MKKYYLGAVAAAVGSFVPVQVDASTITINDPFLQYYNVGPNNLFFSQGEFIRAGATSVIPNGANGTTGRATTINANNN